MPDGITATVNGCPIDIYKRLIRQPALPYATQGAVCRLKRGGRLFSSYGADIANGNVRASTAAEMC